MSGYHQLLIYTAHTAISLLQHNTPPASRDNRAQTPLLSTSHYLLSKIFVRVHQCKLFTYRATQQQAAIQIDSHISLVIHFIIMYLNKTTFTQLCVGHRDPEAGDGSLQKCEPRVAAAQGDTGAASRPGLGRGEPDICRMALYWVTLYWVTPAPLSPPADMQAVFDGVWRCCTELGERNASNVV